MFCLRLEARKQAVNTRNRESLGHWTDRKTDSRIFRIRKIEWEERERMEGACWAQEYQVVQMKMRIHEQCIMCSSK